jgi:hypothetical protein
MLSAAALNKSAAIRKVSSFPPMVNCALKAWTEGMGGGFVTIVAERLALGVEGGSVVSGGCPDRGDTEERRRVRRSLA